MKENREIKKKGREREKKEDNRASMYQARDCPGHLHA